MKWLKPFLDAARAALAAFRKDEPKSIVVRDLSYGLDALVAAVPQIRKVLGERFASRKDDAVLVEEIAAALKPHFPAAGAAERLAGFVIFLSNLGILKG